MLNLAHIHDEVHLLSLDIRLQHIAQGVDKLRKIFLRLMNSYRARFNAAHFQHIIDQGEQMLRGLGDFGQIALHRLLILDMLSSQISEAHNRIHRRSDIMRHVVQKDCLGAVRLLRQHQRLAKLRLMLLLQLQLAVSSSLVRTEQPNDEEQHDQQQDAADYAKDSDQLIRLLIKNSLRRY